MRNQILILLFFLWIGSASAQQKRPIGTNLTSVTDYSTEFVFTDAFKQSREWIAFNADGSGPWDTKAQIPLNAKGFPRQVPFRHGNSPLQKVRTLLLWGEEQYTPKGKYRLIVQGKGTVKLQFGASGTFQCPVDTYVDVNGRVALSIESSPASNPIRDIKFIYPKYARQFQNKVFTDEFLSFVKDFKVLRFMDWGHTNHSTVKTWDQRTPFNYRTQAKRTGVAWEYAIQLCNQANKDAWINIPHRANDQYIRNLAWLLKSQLKPNLKIYLEYSNEVWNQQFAQHREAGELGAQLGYTGPLWERAWKYTAKRSADIFRIF